MSPKIPGQKEGRVKELIAEFEAKSKSGAGPALGGSPADIPEIKKGHVSETKARLDGKGPFETSGRASDESVDRVEISEETSVVDPGTNGGADAALAGLKKPEGNISPHKSTHSTQTPEETGIATQTPEDMSTQTDPMKPEIDIENKPWKGLEKLKECFVGETGMKAGFLKLKNGDIAAGLRDIVTSLVMTPIHAAAMVLDGPRKIGDLASIKGQQLINSSRGDFKGWAGVKAVLKHFAGGLLQAVGGAVRLAVPVAGLVVLMAIPPPPGWIIGGVLLGLYLINELGALVNDGLGETQTVRAGRDLVSGAVGVVGSVVEAIVKPIQFAIHRARREPEASESVDTDSIDTLSSSDEDDAELAAELEELERTESEAAKAEREAEVRDSMPEVSGPSVAERIAAFERGDAPEDDE